MNKHKTVGPIHYGGNDTVRTIQVYVMTAASAGAYPGGGGRVEPDHPAAHPPFSASRPSRSLAYT